jgi:hypothetical protein
MNTAKIPLNMVKVASPCSASWDDMSGSDQARFCRQCAEYVYNLSDMTQDEIAALIKEKEGKVCVRYFVRRDGTIMTADCPVGVRERRWVTMLRFAAAGIATIIISLLALAATPVRRGPERAGNGIFRPLQKIIDQLSPPVRCEMGKR